MAPQLRIEYEGAFYHITYRGNQRDKIFWDAKDRESAVRDVEKGKEGDRRFNSELMTIKKILGSPRQSV